MVPAAGGLVIDDVPPAREALGDQLVDQFRGVLDRVDHAVAVAILLLVEGAGLKPQPERRFGFGCAHTLMDDARSLLLGYARLAGPSPKRAGENSDDAKHVRPLP